MRKEKRKALIFGKKSESLQKKNVVSMRKPKQYLKKQKKEGTKREKGVVEDEKKNHIRLHLKREEREITMVGKKGNSVVLLEKKLQNQGKAVPYQIAVTGGERRLGTPEDSTKGGNGKRLLGYMCRGPF